MTKQQNDFFYTTCFVCLSCIIIFFSKRFVCQQHNQKMRPDLNKKILKYIKFAVKKRIERKMKIAR